MRVDESIADEFSIRASACSEIMAGALLEGGLTAKQKETMETLLAKQAVGTITQKQLDELNNLVKKSTSEPELPSGAKTYCEKWLLRRIELYGEKTIHVYNDQTEKGLTVEDDALDFIAEVLDIPYIEKNEERISNEYMGGTPDARIIKAGKPLYIIDNKSSWDEDTFPLFEEDVPTNGYWWQGQCYMELDNVDHYLLIYTLMDLPYHMMTRRARQYYLKMGEQEVTQAMEEEFAKNFTYSHLPKELRIRVFHFERDRSVPPKIKNRVEMCRKYIRELIQQLNIQFNEVDKFKFHTFNPEKLIQL